MKKRRKFLPAARFMAVMLSVMLVTMSMFTGCGSKKAKKEDLTSSNEMSSKDTSSNDMSDEDKTNVKDDMTSTSDDVTTSGEPDTTQDIPGQTTSASSQENTTKKPQPATIPESTTKKPQPATTPENTTKKPEPTTAAGNGVDIPWNGGTDFGVVNPTGTLTNIASNNRVTVHDPSIEYDPISKKYYIFGSHKAWASSSDLIQWTMTTNNINSNYATVFKEAGTWASQGTANGKYDISGNLWAPDVIYNKDMKKWCMYMSVNGNDYYSSIAMATADSINGPYTYAGTVVYSGFRTSAQAAKTDYAKVTGSNNVAARYLRNGGWNSAYGTNAIDPCVLYDKDGGLWMVYGSWFGGLHILKLDNNTGLRDYTYKYETVTNVSDEYLGKRLSGGYGCTGEGAYITLDKETGYYYLYVSYCGLNATDNFSGYHIRLFRSKDITGPYLDAAGNNAICTKANDDQTVKGVKLMGNYSFSSLKNAVSGSNANNGYMSPGHNSAIIDNAGNHYLIYHTRFNVGQEWHQVRVHQQFLNEDGWPVTAPYEYLGSKINVNGYAASDIVGRYEYINHGLAAATKKTGMLTTQKVNLNADGTITGDVSGTWKQISKDGKGYYATMVIGGVTYKGVFFKQYDESALHKETMVFSLIGTDNRSIWGSKI